MKKNSLSEPSRKAIEQICRQLATIDLACSGTLSTRRKRCGRPSCRCATDPAAAHGPYHEWSRRENGRTVCTIVSAKQSRILQRAIANYRRVQALLHDWDQLSRRIILNESHD